MTQQTNENNAAESQSARPALLDCPFCGGHAAIYGGGKTQEISTVSCLECYATINGRGLHHDHANEAWNRRVNDSSVLNEWAEIMERMNIGGALDLAIKLTRGEARKRAI